MMGFSFRDEEMVTALEMALAFMAPIVGGMYLVARLWG